MPPKAKPTWTCWYCGKPQHSEIPADGRVTCADCGQKSDKRWCSYCGQEFDADELLSEYFGSLNEELCPDCEDNDEIRWGEEW